MGLSADEEDSDGEAAMPPEKKERKREKPAAKKEGEKKSDARILRLAAGMKMLNEKLSKVGGGLKMTDKDIKGYGRGFFGKESRKDWTDEEFEEVRLWIVKCLETGSIYDPIAYRESIQ